MDDNHILEMLKLDSSEDSKDSDSKELFNDEKVLTKTEINEKEILTIGSLRATARILQGEGINAGFMTDFVDDYLKMKISLNRKSRQEFVDVKRSELANKQLESGSAEIINKAGMR